MVTIREEKIADVAAREALLDEAYGAGAFRQGLGAAARRTPAGDRPVAGRGRTRPARRHGPAVERQRRAGAGCACCSARLAVHPAHRNRGIGSTLVRRAIARARACRPWRHPSGRRCAVLRPLRLFRGVDRRPVDARPLRSRPAAGARAQARRARRRARPDRRRRPACAGARSRRPGGGRSARRKRARPARSRGLAAKHKKSGTPRTKSAASLPFPHCRGYHPAIAVGGLRL